MNKNFLLIIIHRAVPNGDVPAATVGRSLTMRLDNIKRQYQNDLVPLTKQREELMREILDLKEARDIFLEETAVLNARNEELAQLNTQYERKLEINHTRDKSLPEIQPQPKTSLEATQAPPMITQASGSSTGTLVDDVPEVRTRIPRPEAAEPAKKNKGGVFPWAKLKEASLHALPGDAGKTKKRLEHAFQQISVLRFARCDLCGDKMWGSQARCSCALSEVISDYDLLSNVFAKPATCRFMCGASDRCILPARMMRVVRTSYLPQLGLRVRIFIVDVILPY